MSHQEQKLFSQWMKNTSNSLNSWRDFLNSLKLLRLWFLCLLQTTKLLLSRLVLHLEKDFLCLCLHLFRLTSVSTRDLCCWGKKQLEVLLKITAWQGDVDFCLYFKWMLHFQLKLMKNVSKNTCDGTEYKCSSVENAHSFELKCEWGWVPASNKAKWCRTWKGNVYNVP